MKCKDEPCQDGEHNWRGVNAGFDCMVCGHSYEYRCTKCGWYESTCLCGACCGWSKISSRQQAAIHRRQAEKAGEQ